MKDFFTPTESAEHFGVCEKTIARRLWAKGIPARKVGRTWRISGRILFGNSWRLWIVTYSSWSGLTL